MAYVIVRDVFDPQWAAEVAEQRGERERALLIRRNGKCCLPVEGEVGGVRVWLSHQPSREEIDALLGLLNSADSLPGMRYHSRFDYDPDWSKQRAAVAAAMGAVWQHRQMCRLVAVPAVNAFNQAYYGWGEDHGLADPTERPWSSADRRNFSDGARSLANAVAGLRLTEGAAPADHVLVGAVHAGWAAVDERHPEPANGWYTPGTALELVFGLAYVMRQHGEPHLDWLLDAVKAGANGNS